MKPRTLIGENHILPALLTAGLFLYLVFVVRPAMYAHHSQEAFLFAGEFVGPLLTSAGGPSVLIGKLFMQFLYLPLPGIVVLFTFLVLVCMLTYLYLRSIAISPALPVISMIPGILGLILLNNYNFPFSVLSGMFIAMAGSVIATSGSHTLIRYIFKYLLSAIAVYYLAGPGFALVFVLFQIPAGFLFSGRLKWIILSANLLFALGLTLLSPDRFWFFPDEVYFKSYIPTLTFYAFLVFPFLLGVTVLILRNQKFRKWVSPTALGITIVLIAAAAHLDCYSADAHRVAACDYYCYHGDAERTASMATSLADYSFAANLNYNLVMGKTGQLPERVFDFFQISGTMSLQPDIDFATELAFVAADFYYEIGLISEARHWAYEALVFYPHSPRALEMLVKVHTVLGEYGAAGRTLNILKKGLVRRDLIRTYGPLLADTTLIAADREIMEKRNCIPAQKELNPYIEGRLRELLDANKGNTMARDYLLIYYLMDGNLGAFSDLYTSYGPEPPGSAPLYEEALLIQRIDRDLPPDREEGISEATLERFGKFTELISRYGEDENQARNALYWEMGTTYLYYYYFLYPRIVKPALFEQNPDEIPI